MPATVSLAALVLQSPAITGGTVSVNLESFPVTLAADLNTVEVDLVIVETGVVVPLTSYTVVGNQRIFTGSITLPTTDGVCTLQASGKNAGGTAVTPNLTLSIIKAVDPSLIQVLPPAGVQVLRLPSAVRVQWQTPTTPGLLGVRVLASTDPLGIAAPYTQLGGLLAVSTLATQETLSSSTTTVQTGNTTVTTTTDQTQEVQLSALDITPSAMGGATDFFVMLTTVVQDPATGHIYESFAVGPFECAMVDLAKVQPADFPVASTKEAIAGRLITNPVALYPGLDLSPRSEPRDLFVDPVAIELADMQTRIWFAMVSRSLDALVAVDDADGDGISDNPAISSFKQTLMAAFHINGDQLQTIIDKQFDVHGAKNGVDRKQPQAAVGQVTFYVTTKPKNLISISLGAVVATIPDANTPSVTYTTLGSGFIDPANLAAYYDPVNNWWAITLPCLCQTTGTIGNVGAETIRTVLSGVSQAMQCINPAATDFGTDLELNVPYAARIRNQEIIGKDTGRREAYTALAESGFGVIEAATVCAGDIQMLRDWDSLRQKHIFGTIDVYCRGTVTSQGTDQTPFVLETLGTQGVPTTYATLKLLDPNTMRFAWGGAAPAFPGAAIVELYAQRIGVDPVTAASLSRYLGVSKARYDAQTGYFYLDPAELTYQLSNGVPVTGAANSVFAAGLTPANTIFYALVRLWSPFSVTPANQPVASVFSVAGKLGMTGVVSPTSIRLVHTADPQLLGGSQQAGDEVIVNNTPVQVVVPMTWTSSGPDTQSLGEGVSVLIDSAGNPGNILAVRSLDASILYTFKVDYDIVCTGTYGTFSIKRLAGSSIPFNTAVNVSFNQFPLRERVTKVVDTLSLAGSTATPLSTQGFVRNSWLPASHGFTDLTADSALAAQPLVTRYIKVTYDNGTGPQVMQEGRDFLLTVDPITGAATIGRYFSGGTISSRIPDGGAVVVTYFVTELFTTTSQYPSFMQQVTASIQTMRNGGADVLVKSKLANGVDFNFTVVLAPDADQATVDSKVRTVLTYAVANGKTILSQSAIIALIQAVPGVVSVKIPFIRMAKSDGAYDIGLIVPTGTLWDTMATLSATDSTFAAFSLPSTAFITHNPVLRYRTKPSGGDPDSYVGLLYEGEAWRRCKTIQEFIVSSGRAFYIIGVNDHFDALTPIQSIHAGKILLNVDSTTPNPAALAFRATYQVFGEVGPEDILVSPMEYLVLGTVTIDYLTEGA